jgi:hypothetical protein
LESLDWEDIDEKDDYDLIDHLIDHSMNYLLMDDNTDQGQNVTAAGSRRHHRGRERIIGSRMGWPGEAGAMTMMEGSEEMFDGSEAWPRWLVIRLISGYMGQSGG